MKDEIVEHLSDFLNTKKNLGIYPYDYGIDSYVYLGTDNRVAMQMIEDIKTGLTKYEKRVSDVDIQIVTSESTFLLSFVIKCNIEKSPYAFHLSFHHQKKEFNFEA